MTANVKKTAAFIVAALMVCISFAGIVIWNIQTDNALAADTDTVITLQIDNPQMTLGSQKLLIDDNGIVNKNNQPRCTQNSSWSEAFYNVYRIRDCVRDYCGCCGEFDCVENTSVDRMKPLL